MGTGFKLICMKIVLTSFACCCRNNIFNKNVESSVKEIKNNSTFQRSLEQGHSGVVSSVAVLQNGDLASGSWDQAIKIWDSSTGLDI
jgi:WD40 repeat protein